MAEDDTAHSYQVNQDNKEYIITTQLINDELRVECQDNNAQNSLFMPNFLL